MGGAYPHFLQDLELDFPAHESWWHGDDHRPEQSEDLRENEVKVTFNDVAGVQEAKDELVEIVEFLHPQEVPTPGWENP